MDNHWISKDDELGPGEFFVYLVKTNIVPTDEMFNGWRFATIERYNTEPDPTRKMKIKSSWEELKKTSV